MYSSGTLVHAALEDLQGDARGEVLIESEAVLGENTAVVSLVGAGCKVPGDITWLDIHQLWDSNTRGLYYLATPLNSRRILPDRRIAAMAVLLLPPPCY